MKHIKNFNKYRQSVNEEFIGGLLNGLKNKISLKFSKMFGSASKADKLIEEYKKELSIAHTTKLAALSAYGEYIKVDQKDKNKEKQLLKNINDASKKFDEQIELIKKKFDIKFNEVIENEKNKKIQNYINLKKIEMQQEFLAKEVKSMLTDLDLDQKDIENNPRAKELIKSINDKTKNAKKIQEDQKKALELEEQKEDGFDMEKAKRMAEEGKTYLWEASPMRKYTFEKSDRIKFFSTSNKSETRAIVIDDLGERIKVKTENGNEVEINKKSVISSDMYNNSKSKKEDKT